MGGDPISILYLVFKISEQRRKYKHSPYKRTECISLPAEKGLHQFGQVVVWIIYLCIRIYLLIGNPISEH